jgi:hypothetical protein
MKLHLYWVQMSFLFCQCIITCPSPHVLLIISLDKYLIWVTWNVNNVHMLSKGPPHGDQFTLALDKELLEFHVSNPQPQMRIQPYKQVRHSWRLWLHGWIKGENSDSIDVYRLYEAPDGKNTMWIISNKTYDLFKGFGCIFSKMYLICGEACSFSSAGKKKFKSAMLIYQLNKNLP